MRDSINADEEEQPGEDEDVPLAQVPKPTGKVKSEKQSAPLSPFSTMLYKRASGHRMCFSLVGGFTMGAYLSFAAAAAANLANATANAVFVADAAVAADDVPPSTQIYASIQILCKGCLMKSPSRLGWCGQNSAVRSF